MQPPKAPLDLPGLDVLSEDPLVFTLSGFASPKECAALRAEAAQKLGPPKLSGVEISVDSSVRTGDLAWLDFPSFPASRAYGERVAKMLGRPLETSESLQVVRYLPNERYHAHYDAYDLNTDAGQACAALHGQRVVTALTYLGAPESGGATRFYWLDRDVEPVEGTLLVFYNLGRDRTRPHKHSLHEGRPVEAGVKWIASHWFCEPV